MTTFGDEALAVTARVAAALDDLGVSYVVVGSLASSLHGVPRSTQDADVVAALAEQHVDQLVAKLIGEFYVDGERVRGAVSSGRSFNVIHLQTMFKVDVFVPSDRFSLAELERRERYVLELVDGRTVTLWIASAEDTLLHKLVWYRLGGENSERQWRDVLGVLRVQGPALDSNYLERWSPELEVTELLDRARQEAR